MWAENPKEQPAHVIVQSYSRIASRPDKITQGTKRLGRKEIEARALRDPHNSRVLAPSIEFLGKPGHVQTSLGIALQRIPSRTNIVSQTLASRGCLVKFFSRVEQRAEPHAEHHHSNPVDSRSPRDVGSMHTGMRVILTSSSGPHDGLGGLSQQHSASVQNGVGVQLSLTQNLSPCQKHLLAYTLAFSS
jgi:hypothetical protein